MSQAEELLNSISDETANLIAEEHIVVGRNRFITVPKSLERIAVQYDHNIETVTFDCPRFWDEHDLSEMYIYINYLRTDNVKGRYLVKNLRVDETDSNIIHFDWTIGSEVSAVKGTLMFLLCAVKTDETGVEELHWNSEINKDMYISDGLETKDEIMNKHPDIITDLLTRMDRILVGDGTVLDITLTQSKVAAEAKAVGDRFDIVEGNVSDIDGRLKTLDEEALKEEVDPTVPTWAKEPTKPSYSHDELTDGDMIALKNGEVQNGLNAEMLNGTKLEDIVEIGEIRRFCEEKKIDNYLLCDGSIINSTDYPRLHPKLRSTAFNIVEYFCSNPLSSRNSPLNKIGNEYIVVGCPPSESYTTIYSSTDLKTWNGEGNNLCSMYGVSVYQIDNRIFAFGKSNTSAEYPKIFRVLNSTTYNEKTFSHDSDLKDYNSGFYSIAGNGDNIVVFGRNYKNSASILAFCVYSTDGGANWTVGSGAAPVTGPNELVYYKDGFYASNTTNSGYIQYSSDGGAVFGNYKTNITDAIKNLYVFNDKLIVKTTDGRLYSGTSYNNFVRIFPNDVFNTLIILDNSLYASTSDGYLYKLDITNNTKQFINKDLKGWNSLSHYLVENGEVCINYSNAFYKTNLYNAELPNIAGSQVEGYHYIRAK